VAKEVIESAAVVSGSTVGMVEAVCTFLEYEDESCEEIDDKHEETETFVGLQKRRETKQFESNKALCGSMGANIRRCRLNRVSDKAGSMLVAPTTVALVSGELLTMTDLPTNSHVRTVIDRLWERRPLAPGCMYELLDGPRKLQVGESVRGGAQLTAVVTKDRTQMQPPLQVGDLIKGDVIRARWQQDHCESYQARIQGFTEAGSGTVPRINVQWLHSSGQDWDWDTEPIPLDWVLQLLQPASQE